MSFKRSQHRVVFLFFVILNHLLACSPFFFSFLKGTLDTVGEVEGLVELASAGTAAGVSTSADMLAECASLERADAGSGQVGGQVRGGGADGELCVCEVKIAGQSQQSCIAVFTGAFLQQRGKSKE